MCTSHDMDALTMGFDRRCVQNVMWATGKGSRNAHAKCDTKWQFLGNPMGPIQPPPEGFVVQFCGQHRNRKELPLVSFSLLFPNAA
jgi:hypothetical protein